MESGVSVGTPPFETLAEVEKRQIREVLNSAGGNKTRAADVLGIDRVTLWRKLKKHGLKTNGP
jgi:DNA-binding protein Fis